MQEIKIISNPYCNKIDYEKYITSKKDWEKITDRDGILTDKKYHSGKFSGIVEEVVDELFRVYRDEGEKIFFTFEGTQDEYEKLESAINKNENSEFIHLNPLHRYLESANNILPEIENILNNIKTPISESFAENEKIDRKIEDSTEKYSSYEKFQDLYNLYQKRIEARSDELRKVHNELIKKKANLEEEQKKAEAALDKSEKDLMNQLESKYWYLVNGVFSECKESFEKEKKSIKSEISILDLEEREAYFIKSNKDKIEKDGLKPKKNHKEINVNASDDLLQEIKEKFEQRLKDIKQVFENEFATILGAEISIMKTKLEPIIQSLKVEKSCESKFLEVVSCFELPSFSEPVDGINVSVKDIFYKEYFEKHHPFYLMFGIPWFDEKKLNLKRILEVFEEKFIQEKDIICERIIEKNEKSFKEWSNALYQKLRCTFLEHKSLFFQTIENEEDNERKLEISLSKWKEWKKEIDEKISWKEKEKEEKESKNY